MAMIFDLEVACTYVIIITNLNFHVAPLALPIRNFAAATFVLQC